MNMLLNISIFSLEAVERNPINFEIYIKTVISEKLRELGEEMIKGWTNESKKKKGGTTFKTDGRVKDWNEYINEIN